MAHNVGVCNIPVGKQIRELLTKGLTKNKQLKKTSAGRGHEYVGKTGGYIQALSEFRKMISTFGYKKNSLKNRGKGTWTAELNDGTFITVRKLSSPSISIGPDKIRYTR